MSFDVIHVNHVSQLVSEIIFGSDFGFARHSARRNATRGLRGQPGRAPRRVFLCYDPRGLIPATVEPLVECLSSFQPFPEPFQNSAKEPDMDNCDASFYEALLVEGNNLQRNFAKMRLKTIGAVN